MALCDKALGENVLLKADVQKAEEGFKQYSERIETDEWVLLASDNRNIVEKGAKKMQKRVVRENTYFQQLQNFLLTRS
jgi:hypothetical protein